MTAQNTNPKDVAQDVAAKAKAEAVNAAEHVKDTAAATAEDQAAKLREAGAAFDDNPYARQAAEQISDGLSHLADNIRDADFGTLHQDVSDFARRNPLLFFGGAAALGFVVGRVLKASERAEGAAQPVARAPRTTPPVDHAPAYSGHARWGHV